MATGTAKILVVQVIYFWNNKKINVQCRMIRAVAVSINKLAKK